MKARICTFSSFKLPIIKTSCCSSDNVHCKLNENYNDLRFIIFFSVNSFTKYKPCYKYIKSFPLGNDNNGHKSRNGNFDKISNDEINFTDGEKSHHFHYYDY